MENPNEWGKLKSTPSLVKPAIEELLRYTSPVLMTTERYALENTVIHGVTIPRGGMTLGLIGSANRDKTVFDSPDEFRITREPTSIFHSDRIFTFEASPSAPGFARKPAY